MSRHPTLALSGLAAVLLAATAQAASVSGFQGPLAESQFVTTDTGNLNGAGAQPGTAVFTATTLTLTGGDTLANFPDVGCAGAVAGDFNSPCRIQTVVQAAGSFSFDFDFLSSDSGGPAYDIFGVLLDGVPVPLSDPGGPWPAQSGSASFSVSQSFGWFLNCTDCTGGNATATIGNLIFVPEPAVLALMSIALWAAGMTRQRRR